MAKKDIVPRKYAAVKPIYEVIDDRKAQVYLDSMPYHRALRHMRVDDLVRSAQAGEFSPNIEPLHFDMKGRLRNGQHRMWMVILSGIPQEFMVLRNLSEREIASLDTGTARTSGDVLTHEGYAYGSTMSQALHALYQFKNGNFPGSYNVGRKLVPRGDAGTTGVPPLNNNLLIQFAKEPDIGPRMQQSVLYVESQPAFRRLASKGLWAFIHFIITEVNGVDGAEFFRCMKDAIYRQGDVDPVYKLRKRLERAMVRNGDQVYKLTKTEQCALIIKTWNMWVVGKPCHALRWAHRNSKPEAFPKPISGLLLGS